MNEVENKLRSSDVLAALAGMDEAKSVVERLARLSVALLFDCPSDWCYAVAEKVFALGPAAVPELGRRLGITEGSKEARIHSSLILLKHGSQVGTPELLKALRDRLGPTGAIAEALAHARVPEAGDAVRDALLDWPISKDPYTAATLVSVLRTLGVSPPDEVLRDLEQAAPHVRKLL